MELKVWLSSDAKLARISVDPSLADKLVADRGKGMLKLVNIDDADQKAGPS